MQRFFPKEINIQNWRHSFTNKSKRCLFCLFCHVWHCCCCKKMKHLLVIWPNFSTSEYHGCSMKFEEDFLVWLVGRQVVRERMARIFFFGNISKRISWQKFVLGQRYPDEHQKTNPAGINIPVYRKFPDCDLSNPKETIRSPSKVKRLALQLFHCSNFCQRISLLKLASLKR